MDQGKNYHGKYYCRDNRLARIDNFVVHACPPLSYLQIEFIYKDLISIVEGIYVRHAKQCFSNHRFGNLLSVNSPLFHRTEVCRLPSVVILFRWHSIELPLAKKMRMGHVQFSPLIKMSFYLCEYMLSHRAIIWNKCAGNLPSPEARRARAMTPAVPPDKITAKFWIMAHP